jgi:hypothetical protein
MKKDRHIIFIYIKRIIKTDLGKKKLDKTTYNYCKKKAWSIRSILSLA